MASHTDSDSASSLDDSDDLDDIPLSMAPNGRYEHDEPPMTSRGPPMGFSRPGPGFHLKLPTHKAEEVVSPGPDGLQAMRSEPAYLPETARVRPPPVLSLAMGPARGGSTSYNGAVDESGPMLGRRVPLKPPMLSLVNPASASPVPSGAPTPGVNEAGEPMVRAHAWPPAEPPRRQTVRVDLVSSAFVFQECGGGAAAAASTSTSDRIVQRCCGQLGIAACDLEFFELRPLEVGAIPETCSRVGVMIRGSTFSLSALEDLLARSKRDGQLATMLERSLKESAQHAAEAKQQAEKIAKQNEELAVLRERLRGLEATNQHLREQLHRSDEHRQLLGGTIRTIKREFEDFKSRVVVEGSVEHLPLQQLSLGAAAASVAAAEAAAAGQAPPGPVGLPAAGGGGGGAVAATPVAGGASPSMSPAPLIGSPPVAVEPDGGGGAAAGVQWLSAHALHDSVGRR